MKILYAGNLVNGGFYHTKFSREAGIDMDLLMQKNPEPSSDPFCYDPNLKKYPEWIKFYDRKKTLWKLDILRIMRNSKYDLIHSHVELPIFARFSGKKFIAHTLGSDLKEMAFSNSLRGILLRQAYKKAKIVIYSTPDQPLMLDRLKISNTIYLPLLRDLSVFKKTLNMENEFFEKFIIFHPTTHIWKTKGNDILIQAFAMFLKIHPNSLLLMVDKGVDSKKSKNLINNLGIGTKIQFLSRLNSKELAKYYNLSHVIADQFIEPGLGGIGIEALYCEKPLINSCPPNCYEGMHLENPPVIDANTPETISKELEKLLNNNHRKNIGEKGRKWYLENLSPKTVVKKYSLLYDSILNGESYKTICKKFKTDFH